MSNYSKTTDFAAKDSLPSGDSGKIIRGSEFETEFDNISTAIATKADAADPTFTGTVTIDGLTVNGNTTLGNAATDTVTVTADIASNLIPSADDTYNLGASGAEWNDLFIDGTANIDSLVADTADINGGTIDGVTIGGSSAGAITGTAISGTSFASTGNMTFGDNNSAIFGAGSDLSIFHDGTNSFISDQGSGSLVLRGSTAINLQNGAGTEYLARFFENSSVNLYYDGAQKLATTSTGIDVTGTVTADGLTVAGSSVFSNGTNAVQTKVSGAGNSFSLLTESGDASTTNTMAYSIGLDFGNLFKNGEMLFYRGSAGNNGWITFQTADNERVKISEGGDISFYEDTGTTAKFFWDASAEALGIGTTSPSSALHISTSSASSIELARFRNEGQTNNTGFFFSTDETTKVSEIDASGSTAGNAMALATSGVEKVRIDHDGNVGIGTTSPASALEVADSGVELRITDTRNQTFTAGDTIASLGFYSDDTSGNSGGANSLPRGAIDVVTVNTFGSIHDMVFRTRGDETATASEKMRIDSSGNLLVGTTSASTWTTTAGFAYRPSSSLSITRSAGEVAHLNRLTSDGTILDFRKDGSTVGSIGALSGTTYVAGSSKGVRFGSGALIPTDSSGANSDASYDLGDSSVRWRDLKLSGGVFLGGTAAANKLDDYEEGTFTAQLTASTTSDFTHTTTSGAYTKIGRLVFATVAVTISSKGTSSGRLRVSLPFTVADTLAGTSVESGANVNFWNGVSSGIYSILGLATQSQSYVEFNQVNAAQTDTITNLDAADIDNDFNFRMTIVYQTA